MRVRDHHMLRRRAALPVAVGVVLAACTNGGAVRTSVPGLTLTILTCRDSFGHGQADRGARFVGGIGSPALFGGFTGDNTRWKSRDGHVYLAWKDPIAVAPGAKPYRTITVMSPASARLLFTSPARWGTVWNNPLPIPSRSVRLSSCGSEYASYFGAIMVSSGACVTLAVDGPTERLGTVSVPIDSTKC